jgi:signal transduction histidine kinase
MQTRAALAGARLEFAVGRRGRGTRVSIRMPLAARSLAQ